MSHSWETTPPGFSHRPLIGSHSFAHSLSSPFPLLIHPNPHALLLIHGHRWTADSGSSPSDSSDLLRYRLPAGFHPHPPVVSFPSFVHAIYVLLTFQPFIAVQLLWGLKSYNFISAACTRLDHTILDCSIAVTVSIPLIYVSLPPFPLRPNRLSPKDQP